MGRVGILWLVLWTCAAGGAAASDGSLSLFTQASARAPLIALQPADGTAARGLGSLFAGQQGTSFFAPLPQRKSVALGPVHGGPQIAQLLHLIAQAEAGPGGYDAVQHGAAVQPPKRPTQMTLAEINAWIDRTPGQPHAIGRYQFIPATLRRLVKRLRLPPHTVFSPQVQDRLADLLLDEAGLLSFRGGEIGRHRFMKNLAKIWAGLPTATGQSYYHGVAGNRATMTWAYFEAEMARIFPG